MDIREQWQLDASVLAEIGSALLGIDLPRIEVRLPIALADLAVAAWQREDSEDDPAVAESAEQRQVRHRAAALALIGLSINEHGRQEGDDVVVALSPDLIGDAFRAADEAPAGGDNDASAGDVV